MNAHREHDCNPAALENLTKYLKQGIIRHDEECKEAMAEECWEAMARHEVAAETLSIVLFELNSVLRGEPRNV